jgi:hypothetical protein
MSNPDDYYQRGFRDGVDFMKDELRRRNLDTLFYEDSSGGITKMKKPERKYAQTPKQKLLTKMTKKKWDRYKKGRGKKTYVQIRAEVSRSQAFKKAARRL